MEKFGLIGKLIAAPGKRDELAAILMEAAEGARGYEGCELYAVHIDDQDPDGVWVTEVWRDEAAHRASLQLESTKAAIARGRPLIAGFGEHKKLRTLGGWGLS
jgi:quinol monooxygenase YgiN